MKVLLFTHKNDIDGMGNAILAKLAFDTVEYILCGTFDLKQKVKEYITSGKIYEYEKVFITDLCLDEETLKEIDEDGNLKEKFQIIDHHKTYAEERYTKYPFVKVQLKNDKGLCCGTSLFYEYLVENNFLVQKNIIEEFVELTRQHDTWEWKNVYNNEKARELAILFDALGTEGYINFMYKKLKTEQEFIFNDVENLLINNKKIQIDDAIKEYLNNIHYREILGLKAAIIFIDYQFRNEIAEYLRENKYDIDFVMMVSIDRNVISYRSVKPNVSVRKVAEYFGGKGHEVAATNPIFQSIKEEIINVLIKK